MPCPRAFHPPAAQAAGLGKVAGSVWELPAEGDARPPTRTARLLTIRQVAFATCNSYSYRFSVLLFGGEMHLLL